MNSVAKQLCAAAGGLADAALLWERVRQRQASPMRDDRTRAACCPLQERMAP